MGNIYRNSTLTIVAAHSESAHLGFLGSNAPYEGCELPFILPDGTMDTIIAVPGDFGPRMPPLPLDTRAWSMQEQMLAPRHLVFNLQGIGWKCQTKDFEPLSNSPFEKFAASTPFEVPRLPSSVFTGAWSDQTHQRQFWETIVQEYCKRKLTYFEDRLPALAGIAAQLQDVWKDTYIAGMWEGCLLDHLSWQVDSYVSAGLPPGKKIPYVAPSWSWISIPHEVRFALIGQVTASIQRFSIEPQSRDAPFGQIKRGFVNILTQANDQSMKARFPEMDRERLFLDAKRQEKLEPDVLYLKLGDWNILHGRKEAMGLLIKPVGDGTYRRIGMFEWREDALYDNVPRKVFRLV